MKKIALLLSSLAIGFVAQAQVTLTGTSYTQNFDGIGGGLPQGWSIDSATTATTKGYAMVFDTTRVAWNTTTGRTRNYAAKGSFAWNETTANQAAATNRALGIRQVGATDSNVAFTLQIANTTGLTNFNLSFKLMSLDSTSPRVTTWKVEYATGTLPAAFNTASTGTYTTGGNTFSSNTVTANFGNSLNNQSGPVWIRVSTSGKTTGTGNRASSAIDDFSLTYSSGTGPSYRPNITSIVPASNATGVAPNANLQITFDRQVTGKAAGNIRIKNVTDQTTVTKAGNAADVTVAGNVVTVANTGLVAGKSYYVTFDSTAFDTASYKSYGVYDTTYWKFATVNYGPSITPVSPIDGASGVTPTTTGVLKMAFSRKVTKGATGNIIIKNETDQTTQTKAVTSADVALSANGDTATISNVTLVTAKAYHVTVDPIAFDTAGFASLGITDTTRWNFTTQGPILTVTAIDESFEASCPTNLPAGWLQYSVEGPSQYWRCGTGSTGQGLTMNGGGASSSTLNEDWLITPKINPVGQTNVNLAFKAKYNFAGPNIEVKYSTDYTGTGNPNAATWANYPITFTNADSNIWVTKTAPVSNAAQLFIAFKYTSTAATPSNGRQWTVDSVVVKSSTSGVGTINSNANTLPVQVLGTATNNHVMIGFDLEKEAALNATIVDLAGRIVYTTSFRAAKGNNKITLAPQSLQSGMYIIRISNGTQQGIARTFID